MATKAPLRLPLRACPALLALLLLAAPTGAVASGGGEAQTRVVSGQPAASTSAPWMAAVVEHSRFGGTDHQRQFCGGSVISSRVLMTAAHCVHDRQAADLQVVVGRADLQTDEGRRIDVAAVVVNPLFTIDTYRNDVALLLLAEPTTQPALPLAPPGDRTAAAPWTQASVMGWGATAEGSSPSPVLMEAGVTVLPNRSCSRRAAYGADFVGAEMLCVGGPPDTGSCSGDSGGPLTAAGRAIGIVSWARGCARPDFPTVYTKLSNPSINGWVRAAGAELEEGRTSAPPPRTVVRKVGLRSRAAGTGLQFAAPGESWASFQCSSRGRAFRICPASPRARTRSLKSGTLRVRALNLFGSVDPTPATLHSSRRP